MSKPRTAQPTAPPTPRRRNRSYGKRSPIDKLSEAVRHELRRKLRADVMLREIQSWLKTEHGCAISQQGISAWVIRREADERAEVLAGRGEQSARASFEGLEIVVVAPGASEVRIQVRAMPTGGGQ
jgi:hypothetical protein